MRATASGHHSPGDSDGDDAWGVALVRLADYLANTMEAPRADLGFDPDRHDPEALYPAAGLDITDFTRLLPRVRDEVQRSAPFLRLS